MKVYLFILVLIYIAMAQEQWETIYTSFNGNNPNDAEGWIVSNNYQGNLFTKCNGVTLFGGYYAFGNKAIVSKLFKLPPHYQLKITFQFWKIDSWDNESVYLIAEDYKWSQDYIYYQGTQLCGSYSRYWNEMSQLITFVINHNSESLVFIMTTNLDQYPDDESWGIRDFSIQILRCPQGCLYCQDNDYNNCYYWIGLSSLWHESIEVDGWIKNNNNMQPTIDKCVSFDIIKLAPNDKLEKIIENLNAHYKMQVQLQIWKIDSWNNEMFILEIDDQIYNQTILESTGIYNICGSNGLENIINIAITLPHSLYKCKITMRTNHNSITTNAYWGIRAFNIYLAKCITGCDQCLGPLKTECTVCSSGWVFYKNICTHRIHQSQSKLFLCFFHKSKLLKLKIQNQMKGFLWRLIYQKLIKKQLVKVTLHFQLIIINKF
ncbi:unnamed protein product [Paramecium primaurelia]|uniref:Uncharacterized protein n=1 Tax=Paramecium primaurelia TaxID=5886 RepID=A0A8S1L1E6_PARPR|nr:unnamed protein product [Paramecium primaurelia]